VKKTPEDIIERKTEKVLEITKLGSFKDKFPPHLSGGQQQRVALARAIIAEPKVLLLDEPLSNLDAKLREEMRSEIRRIQKETGITMIYVTHDQKEAMSLGDRITVMDEGLVIQTGSPMHLYSEPGSKFVASFLGDINILEGRVVSTGDFTEVETSEGKLKVLRKQDFAAGDFVEVAFRPENAVLSSGANNISCRVNDVEYYGETFKANCITRAANKIELKSFTGNMKQLESGADIQFSVAPENFILFGKK